MNTKNMKKVTSTLFALVLGLGVAGGVNYVLAGDFKNPTTSFPTCPTTNPACSTPLNVSSTDQVKPAGLSVDAFVGSLGARFKQSVQFDQLAGTGDRDTCADSAGRIKICGPATYSGVDDLVVFSLTFNGGSSFTLGTVRPLITTNPAHLTNPFMSIAGATKVATGHYELDVVYDGSFHIDSSEIISASLMNSTAVSMKISMANQSGNNRVEFKISDDASNNDLSVGDKLVFMFSSPTIR